MLNRRIIRGKVMQQIFAYERCVAANSELTVDRIIAHFTPDLNAETPQDAKLLEGYAKLTITEFNAYVKSKKITENTLPEPVMNFYLDSIAFYNTANKVDKNRILNKLIIDTEALNLYTLSILQLLIVLSEKLKTIKKDNALINNSLIIKLIESEELQKELLSKNLSWDDHEDVISDIILNLATDENYKNYKAEKTRDSQTDNQFVYSLVKNNFFKNAKFNDHFESIHLNWQEDKVAVKDIVIDTLKNLAENPVFCLAPISKNWTDDKSFLETLFLKTIERNDELESYISPKLKNWDISRLTGTDSILMKQCLLEMIQYPAIPVKVSINEYIDISKRYSTPKSKTIINGVLDAVSEELIKAGIIKKSGRGLIDNK
jgi:N utilization substance protein B